MDLRSETVGLVLLAGELHDFPIRQTDWAFIVAADAGAIHALNQGVIPTKIIGDLDSLPADQLDALTQADAHIVQLPVEKDFTDGEAAVHWAVQQDVDTIIIAGALGGRFDHALASVLLLEHLHKAEINGWATDGRQTVHLLHEHLDIPGLPGDQLSIIPLTHTVDGVSLQGVKWPLSEASLTFASTWSLSNEFAAEQASVSIDSGRALVVTTLARFA